MKKGAFLFAFAFGSGLGLSSVAFGDVGSACEQRCYALYQSCVANGGSNCQLTESVCIGQCYTCWENGHRVVC